MVALNAAAPQADPAAMLWARLANQRLRLRDTVTVHEHRYRGRRWYLLRDTLAKQQYRLSRGVYRLIERLDGRKTLAEAYARLDAGGPGRDGAPPELLTTLTQLHAESSACAAMAGTDASWAECCARFDACAARCAV